MRCRFSTRFRARVLGPLLLAFAGVGGVCLSQAREVTFAQSGVADFVGSDSDALQAAVDRLKPGDRLTLGPGTYAMRNSLFVPAGVTVRGTRDRTILLKDDGVESALTEDGDYGETTLKVAEPAKFRVGMGLTVSDDTLKSDWDVTVVTVVGIQGDVLQVRPMMLRDYDAGKQRARVRNTFPILCVIEADYVVLEDLIVDGNKSGNAFLDGCRGGAIYLYQAKRAVVRNCVARNYNGDGISFQLTEDVRILGCDASGNTSHGLHPGAGSLRPVVRGSRAVQNGRAGLFLCWRVRFGEYAENELSENGEHGISLGHKDTDNRFLGNTIARNRVAGVFFRDESLKNSAHRNLFEGNTVADNGGSTAGYGFRIAPRTDGIVIRNNRIVDTRPPGHRTQRHGIHYARGAMPVQADANTLSGHVTDEYFVAEAK